MKKNKILDDNYNDKLFFPFSDRYIQEYYHFNYDDISYFLKLSLLYGRDIYITGANVWQSKLTYVLYKNAYELIDQEQMPGMIHLSTRKMANSYHMFDDYFIERSEESEHFLTLPGVYALLDSQIYDTRDIARQLDGSVLPRMRTGPDVSSLMSKNILNLFRRNNIYIDNNIHMYLHGKLLSRTAIVNYIMGLPYSYRDIVKLIEQSNFSYYLANAESNEAGLLYPRTKYEIVFCNGGSVINFSRMCCAASLSKEKLRCLSFQAISHARTIGILENVHMLFRFLTNAADNRLIKSMLHRSILALVDVMIHFDKTRGDEFKVDVDGSSEDAVRIFFYNLNKLIAEDSYMGTNENKLSFAVMNEEIIHRFSLDEIKDICINIFGDYEQFPHSTKTELSRELCLKCIRSDKMNLLLGECIKQNSSFNVLSGVSLMTLSLDDWRGDGDKIGDILSYSEQEKVIESRSRFQSVSFLERGMEIKDRICMVKTKNGERMVYATGLLLKNDYVITNKHVLPNENSVQMGEAVFGYDDCKNSVEKRIDFDEKDFFISQECDLTLAKLKNASDMDEVPGMRTGDPEKCLNDIVPIIQHPRGYYKQICIGHNSLVYADTEVIQYLTDTLPGSSGSPVFNSEWELIGLHSRGGNICEPRTGKTVFRNEGISIQRIRKFIEQETNLGVGDLL
ncbi:MAG: serine protease [Lachnospiraceae bacterium]|nr:serine protease [Lachnospiraceae bacterium]